MPRTILVIQGHPEWGHRGLCRAIADSYAEGAAAGGHTVHRLAVADLDFPLLRSQAQFETGPVPTDIERAQRLIREADHLVLVFPLWLGDVPAVLKGFLEQALRPGFAFRYRARGLPEKLLSGRTARLFVTMGMPALVYRWFYGAHGLKNLRRNILAFVGYGPVRDTVVGSVGTRSRESLERSLAEVSALGRSAR